MKLRLYISPKKNILDPQASMISKLLSQKQYAVSDVSRGKFFDISFDNIESKDELESIAHALCKEIFANQVSEDYNFEILE